MIIKIDLMMEMYHCMFLKKVQNFFLMWSDLKMDIDLVSGSFA